jgi:RHS repeat-associated protein
MDVRKALGALAFTVCAFGFLGLQTVHAQTTVGTYTYNAKGQRITKMVGGVTTRFSYDEAGHLVSEISPTNTRDYIYLGDILVNTVDTPTSPAAAPSTIGYVTTDHKGTPRAVSDSTGTVVWQNPYQGNPFEELQPTSLTGYTLNVRGQGEYYDEETGLNYNIQRYRDTSTWRFLQSDPKGLAAGMSTYAVTDNDPLGQVDPDGLQTTMEKCLYPQNAAACAAAGIIPQAGATSGAASAAANTAAIGSALTLSWAAEHAPSATCPPTGGGGDDGDDCHKQFDAESKRCNFWANTGPDDDPQRWVRACQERAADRRTLCLKGADTMPGEFSFKDID